MLDSADRKKNYFAFIGLLRELRGILGALYEAKGKVAPEPATVACTALGMTGDLRFSHRVFELGAGTCLRGYWLARDGSRGR